MPRTLGYHIVISGYGLWLPGDDRGHWSEAWDAELGYLEPHQLLPHQNLLELLVSLSYAAKRKF